MKKYFLTTVALISISVLFAFKSAEGFVGHWKITKVEFQQKDEVKTPALWIEFSENGRMVKGKDGKKANITGEWSYNEENKTLSFKGYKKSEGDGTYKVDKLTDNELVLSKDGRTIYLTKTR